MVAQRAYRWHTGPIRGTPGRIASAKLDKSLADTLPSWTVALSGSAPVTPKGVTNTLLATMKASVGYGHWHKADSIWHTADSDWHKAEQLFGGKLI